MSIIPKLNTIGDNAVYRPEYILPKVPI